MNEQSTVTIVGGGSSAHLLIPLLSMSGHVVNILTRRPEMWSNVVEAQLQSSTGQLKRVFQGRLSRIGTDPKDVIPQADVVVLCLPVSKYRSVLHKIAPYVEGDEVFVGTIYGQGGFNWMIDEVRGKFKTERVIAFAVGLIPWICRTIEYGKAGVTYGSKAFNVVALSPKRHYDDFERTFLRDICERWFGTGSFHQAENFLSLTLSVDNQIIHPARCYGLFEKYGGVWEAEQDIPYFYRDFDQESADLMSMLDAEYSLIREAIKTKYPSKDFRYMLDYLALERLSYKSNSADIVSSFTGSETLGAIKPPTVRLSNGKWVIDTRHRFFSDDIHYGLRIARWIAGKLRIEVPTIDRIVDWALETVQRNAITYNLHTEGNDDTDARFKSGVPSEYGFETLEDIVY